MILEVKDFKLGLESSLYCTRSAKIWLFFPDPSATSFRAKESNVKVLPYEIPLKPTLISCFLTTQPQNYGRCSDCNNASS